MTLGQEAGVFALETWTLYATLVDGMPRGHLIHQPCSLFLNPLGSSSPCLFCAMSVKADRRDIETSTPEIPPSQPNSVLVSLLAILLLLTCC